MSCLPHELPNDYRKWENFNAVYLSFHWLKNFGFELVTRGIDPITRGFELVTRGFELATRGFELVTRGFEMVTHGFELVDLNSLF